jgi:hypothetical protein
MAFLTFVGGMFIYIVLALYRGLALSLLWGWYVVPTFDAPSLSVIVAIGLSIIVSMFTPMSESKKEWTEAFLTSAVSTTIYLVFGWLWSFAL